MKLYKSLYLFLAVLLAGSLLAFTTVPQAIRKVRLKMETKTLQKGTYSKVQSEVFYRFDQGTMVQHYTYPVEFFFLSNDRGEAKIYDPKHNTISIKQGKSFSSENNYLYYFLSNNANDLGFKEQGFQLQNTRFENGYMVTDWLPPRNLSKTFAQVEMVHENYLPIFIRFIDAKGATLKKVYYYQYQQFDKVSIPMRVTQIDFFTEVDSSITKTSFSELKTGDASEHEYFNYQVPDNARVVE